MLKTQRAHTAAMARKQTEERERVYMRVCVCVSGEREEEEEERGVTENGLLRDMGSSCNRPGACA